MLQTFKYGARDSATVGRIVTQWLMDDPIVLFSWLNCNRQATCLLSLPPALLRGISTAGNEFVGKNPSSSSSIEKKKTSKGKEKKEFCSADNNECRTNAVTKMNVHSMQPP